MTTQEKKDKIKALAVKMLDESRAAMVGNIEKALNCGAIDPSDWDENYAPMILPKAILTAVLQSEADQYDGSNTSFAKEIKATVKNLRHFI